MYFFAPDDLILAPSVLPVPPCPSSLPVKSFESDGSDVMLTDGSDLFPFVLIQGPFAERACSWSYCRSSLSTELTEEPERCNAVHLDLKQNNKKQQQQQQSVVCVLGLKPSVCCLNHCDCLTATWNSGAVVYHTLSNEGLGSIPRPAHT